MNGGGDRWGVILAGGSGRRLQSLTADASGTVVPKQFCSVFEGPSLLRTTIRRMRSIVKQGRILIVVNAEHRRWWEPELADIPPENILVQPCDRGTACGVLLPLTSILYRDPDARIVMTPSDHFVRDEKTLMISLLDALAHVEERPQEMVLLGMVPDRPDTEYGWITPSSAEGETVPLVTSFVEKPDEGLAQRLMLDGALWSSFMFAATGDALMDQFRQTLPWLVDRFASALDFVSRQRPRHDLLRLYDRLPSVDFSKRVLQQINETLRVLAVPPCGWTDLGTPQRLLECISSGGTRVSPDDRCAARMQTGQAALEGQGDRRRRPAALDLTRAASRVVDANLSTPG